MNKKIISLFAFASILSLSVCNTSCSDDDDDDPIVIPTVTDTTNNTKPSDETKDPANTPEEEKKSEVVVEAENDAKVAASIITSIEGKSLNDLMSDTELIAQVSDYKDKYDNGSDEYKAAFKAEIIESGVSNEVVELLSKEGEIDYMSLALALGVKLF